MRGKTQKIITPQAVYAARLPVAKEKQCPKKKKKKWPYGSAAIDSKTAEGGMFRVL
jgi:hypothetical protein